MIWRRRSVVCVQAVRLVTQYLEGTLSGSARRRLEAHLADCPHCEEYFAQMRRTIATVGRVDPGDLSQQTLDDLVTLYRSWTVQ
jgi:anti-sigma factor RsiW